MKVVVSVFADPAWTMPARCVASLRARFPHITFGHATNDEQLIQEIRDAEVAFLSRLRPDQFAAARALRWIHSPAAGVGGLMYPEIAASPVVITNSRGIHADTIAEHVMGVIIALFRRFPLAERRQTEHRWAKGELSGVRLLRGQTMGIIGMGAIGSTIARLGAAFGMRVIATRRHPDAPRPAGVDEVLPPSQLADLLAASDVVVLAAPLTPETRWLIRSTELRQMKREAFLVNIARGKLVTEEDLAVELAAGTIAGAALDVFEHEPLDPASPLWDLPNVIITPHTSGFRADYWEAATDLFADNLRRYERGEPLFNVVDKAAGY